MNNSLEMILNQTMMTSESVEIEKVIKTSPSQLEIWLACKMGGKEASMAYNESISLLLKGELDVDSLKKAFSALVIRHEGMRTIVSPNGKNLFVFSDYEMPIRFLDISDLSSTEKETYLKKRKKLTGNFHFNLSQGPLYVLEVIKIDSFLHQLTFSGHHIIFDGWSLGLMLRELSVLYSNLTQGIDFELERPDTLADYSAEIINRSRKYEHKETKKYWKEYLSNPFPDFSLPITKDRPIFRTYETENLEFPVDQTLMIALRQTSVEEKISLNLLLISILEIFLKEWTNQPEVVIGMPVSGQLGLNKPKLIGHCVHLLPLRSQVDKNLTLSSYLQERKANYIQALSHQFLSMGEMIKEIPIKRDASKISLIPITFNMDLSIDEKVDFQGLEHIYSLNPKSYSNFEIIINLIGSNNEFKFEWTYNKSLFDRAFIQQAGTGFLEFLKEFPKHKNKPIQEVLNDLGNRLQIKNEPEIKFELPENKFIHVSHLIDESFQKYSKKQALEIGDSQLTYEELGQKVEAMAVFFDQQGVKPGDIIGLNLDRNVNLVVATLGVLKCGAGLLLIDLDFPEERVKFMLKDAGVKFFLSDQKTFDWSGLISRKLEFPSNPEKENLVFERSEDFKPEDPALIVYTSGSTGLPKGVVLTNSNLFHFSQHIIKKPGLSHQDKILGVTSISFDMAWLDLVIPFAYGATMHLLGKYERKDQRELFNALVDQKITKLYITPSYLKTLVLYMGEPRLEGLTIISAGEPLPMLLAKSALRIADSLYNIYGPSETTIFSTIKKIEEKDEEITLGHPVEGTCIVLVDENENMISNAGKMGEIWIGGTALGKGYLNREELTKEKFIKSPFKGYNGRFYKSGDLGLWNEEGELLCKGRIDHQVKIRGQRLELGEIENTILEDHSVKHAIVLKITDSNEESFLQAYVSFKTGLLSSDAFQLWQSSCKQLISKTLASYMVPSSFGQEESFELTSNGKIDRNYLEKLKKNEIILDSELGENGIQALNTPLNAVKIAWEEVLGEDQNDIKADFFRVGGHSLLAVDLLTKLEKQFNISLPLSKLFEFPTIETLAQFIARDLSQAKNVGTNCLVKIKDGDPEKVLLFIHGVGLNPLEIRTLEENMDDDQTIWGLQSPAIQDPKTAPLKSLEEVAQVYIQQIKMAGLIGPYKLMGNSIGGLIAFEMAKQLLKLGEQVQFLGMIDTIALHYDLNKKGIGNKIIKAGKKLWFECLFLIQDPAFYFKYRERYLLEKRENWKDYIQNQTDNTLHSRIKSIEHVNMEAWKKYQLEPIDVKITLFLANRRTFYVEDPSTFGWKPYAKEIEILNLPGEHANMLKPPQGKEFTTVLQHTLNSFQE
ncbi:MAG: amino acid adenylation domain-containing protein [Bacteroidota bacterium]